MTDKGDYKKVRNFLKNLTAVELRYLELTLHMVSNLKALAVEFTKEEFCKKFGIKLNQYEKYLAGDYIYTLHDMATLNCVYREVEINKIKNHEVIQIAKERE